ncbi:DUF6597 domain-containing transcriptional factor [Spongiimicrobium salis]|uniref:DUF6597 domain-containing transcriptional factor n=1 Tax=Spongiimicrobium salis TaxID=1667022 RepID=UPI00374DF63E
MIYRQQAAGPALQSIIKSFWCIDSEGDYNIRREKIIPDGYPEMIFHYGHPYKANISGKWFVQQPYLIAGQITDHFFLENTGKTGMIGIKFQPWALKEIFHIDMASMTNRVIPIPNDLFPTLEQIKNIAISTEDFEAKIAALKLLFLNFNMGKATRYQQYHHVVQQIIETKGQLRLQEILQDTAISERSLERYFKAYIGLSPKLFSRIIRFSGIFNLIQEENFEWTEISFLSGFYDQSHFIKNFKEFTGEEPSKYGFDAVNMANLFLRTDPLA